MSNTLEENAAEIQRVFNRDVRVLALIAEAGAGKSYAVESYVRNGGAISLSVRSVTAREAEQRFQKRNLPSFACWKPRRHLWEQVKKIPVEVRMATPFQRGNVCEDPERCDALEKKGGNPSESICPQCPVYRECQQRGYLSQSVRLKNAKVQILSSVGLPFNPEYSDIVEEILDPLADTERLCIINKAAAQQMFLRCNISKNTLEKWRVSWQGRALGNFADALLNVLQIRSEPNDNAMRRIRAVIQAFEQQSEELIQQMCQVNVQAKVVARGTVDAETGKEIARFTVAFEGGVSAYIPLDDNAADRLIAQEMPLFRLRDFLLNEDLNVSMLMTQAIALGILDVATVENIKAFPSVYRNPNWTLWHQLKRFFAYYMRDADAPLLWTGDTLKFWVPPVLHPSVKRLLFMSSRISERDLHRAFPNVEIEAHHIKPTAWATGNQVFQLRTGFYPRQTILNYETDWDVLGMSETGHRFFLGIQAEIERDPSVKHVIVTSGATIPHLQHIAAKENVWLVGFKKVVGLDTRFKTADVIWIVGAPYWIPSIIWLQSQILLGNDEKPLCYDGEAKFGDYQDERVQSVYERNAASSLARIIGRAGLNRLPNKTVILLTGIRVPDITNRPETLLFDWEDFEVAGGLDKLPEVIAERQHFETERDNLTAESPREKVEQVLGISSSQANRVLMKLRGGKLRPVPFREQILSYLSDGEKKSMELIEAIEGHPGSIRNTLKRLIDTGEIVKVRRSIYALPSKK